MPDVPYIKDLNTERTDIGDRLQMRRYYRQNRQNLRKQMRHVHETSTSRTEGGVSHERRHTYLPDGRSDKKKADLDKVVDTITKEVQNKELAQRLVDKVTTYNQTHSKSFDLTNEESAKIYHNVNFDDTFKLPDRELDVEWKNHAKYRSELRNVNPKIVNEQVRKDMSKRIQQHRSVGDERLKTPHQETVVVDYSLDQNPAEVEVVTVWASELVRIAKWIKRKS
jgi:hypothetical protein